MSLGDLGLQGTPQIENLYLDGPRPWVDVVSKGAVQGIADHGTAWNIARAALPSTGGIVFVPAGAYTLLTPFTFGGQGNVLLLISAGVTLAGAALPAATGTNTILDLRNASLTFAGTISGDVTFDLGLTPPSQNLRFKHSGLANTPTWRIGTIQIGGDGSPGIRVYYSDAVTAERAILDFDNKGIFASVRNAPAGRGSHFEAFLQVGDTTPVFRLNSFPAMTLELGPGGVVETDVHIRRTAVGTMSIFTSGIERLILDATRLIIGSVTEVVLGPPEVNLVLAAAGENEVRFARTSLADTPTFRVGRLVLDGASVPRFRIVYQDNVLAERMVAFVGRAGDVGSNRQTLGEHFVGFIQGDAQPTLRLTSAGSLPRLELGPGGAVAPDIALYRAAANALATDGEFRALGGLKVDVVPTASLPAAGAAQNGRILLEDAAAGDRNLILYAGGERFRIDGGAAV